MSILMQVILIQAIADCGASYAASCCEPAVCDRSLATSREYERQKDSFSAQFETASRACYDSCCLETETEKKKNEMKETFERDFSNTR